MVTSHNQVICGVEKQRYGVLVPAAPLCSVEAHFVLQMKA